MSLASYPRFYRGVADLLDEKALETKTARAIVRKSGVRSTPGGTVVVPARPRTVVDAFIDPAFGSLRWQWLADLTNFSRIRFVSSSDAAISLMYSLDVSAVYDPADWQSFVGTHIESGTPDWAVGSRLGSDFLGGSLDWVSLDESARAPLRMSINSTGDEMVLVLDDLEDDLLGFSVAVQVF